MTIRHFCLFVAVGIFSGLMVGGVMPSLIGREPVIKLFTIILLLAVPAVVYTYYRNLAHSLTVLATMVIMIAIFRLI